MTREDYTLDPYHWRKKPKPRPQTIGVLVDKACEDVRKIADTSFEGAAVLDDDPYAYDEDGLRVLSRREIAAENRNLHKEVAELRPFKGMYEDLCKQQSSLEKANTRLFSQSKDYVGKINTLAADNLRLSVEVDKLNAEIDKMGDENLETIRDNVDLRFGVELLEKERDKLRDELNESQKRLGEAHKYRSLYEENLANHDARAEILNEVLESEIKHGEAYTQLKEQNIVMGRTISNLLDMLAHAAVNLGK